MTNPWIREKHALATYSPKVHRRTEIQDSNDDAEAFNFELASNLGKFSKSQTYRLPKHKAKRAEEVVNKISALLSDDDEFNICVLLKLLNEKVK